MAEKTFTIPKISCGHCVMAVKNELSDLDGVRSVEGTPDTRKVTVVWDNPATEEDIRRALAEIDYPAE
ncbi:MAG: heavy-metal-associated domain-containing protein [Desulfatibacillaceae bacterium]